MNQTPDNTSDEDVPDQTPEPAESAPGEQPRPVPPDSDVEEEVVDAFADAAAREAIVDTAIDAALEETVTEAVVDAATVEAASDAQIQESFEDRVGSAVEAGLAGEELAEEVAEAAADADTVEAIADAAIEEALEETVAEAVTDAAAVEAATDAQILGDLADDLDRIADAEEPAEEPEVVPAIDDAPAAEEPEAVSAAAAGAVAAEEPVEPEPQAGDPFRGPGDWYVVHTYAGYENKVKTNLESRIHTMQMEDKIFDVHIPMEDVMEIKGGKKQVVQRKVFPGYLLVKMIYDNDSWYVVRNTPGVTGFVAAGTGSKPTPLSKREVEKILAVKKEEVKPQFRLGFEEGDVVRIISGPFADFNGTISEINLDQSKLKVLVNIFDRETPVELSFDQVAKV
ncbi:MAG: transcription termination/antitermination protein NusG [Actinomycetota bacterium]